MLTDELPYSLSAVELIAYCGRTDDPEAWREFIKRFHSRILLYVLRERRSYGLTDNEAEAVTDLVQEVYLRLLANDRRALREFRGESEPALLAYLASIARSVVSDQVRRETRQKRAAPLVSIDRTRDEKEGGVSLADILPAGEDSSPDRISSERLAPQRLRALLLSSLNGANAARDAIIFQLYAIDGLTAREIAELPAFKMTVMSVEAVIRRTRERLRAALSNLDTSGLSV